MRKTLLAIALSAVATAVYADEFDTLDVDVDGNLTQEEMIEYSGVVQYWTEIDTDGDGMIDKSEFAAMTSNADLSARTGWQGGGGPDQAQAEPGETGDLIYEFGMLDVNNDGRLSRDEMQMHGGVVGVWADIDANQDDVIDADEFSAFEADATMTERTGWNDRTLPPTEENVTYLFDDLDADRDGRLSRAEMEIHAGVVEYWADVDRNQDDFIDSDEFATFEADASLAERTGWDRKGNPPTTN